MDKSIDVLILQNFEDAVVVGKLDVGGSYKLYETGINGERKLCQRNSYGLSSEKAEKLGGPIGLNAMLLIENDDGVAKITYGENKLEFTETTDLEISQDTKIRLQYS